MRCVLVALVCSLALAACGSAAAPGQPGQPGQIQATPGAQQTSMPTSTPGGGYEGY
jgi:hypothetical protein